MDFQHTRISLRRPLVGYTKIQLLIGHIVRNRRWFIDRERSAKKEYLDVGCGPNIHDNFINLDFAWRPGIDVCWDITRGIPLPDGAVRGIFSEHCLEHFSLDAADRVIREFRRVLKPGGCARIVVPDGELYLTQYTDIVRNQTTARLPYSEVVTFEGLYSPIMSVNWIFREHGHLFIHDFNTLRLLLEKNGFTDVKKESYKTGRVSSLLIDTESRSVESLYVEALAN